MRILHVDDDIELSAVLRRGLQAERLAVDTVTDGECGLNYFQTYTYDLVMLEAEIPRMSGHQLLKHIRRCNEHVPILVLTRVLSLSNKVTMFEGGADDYLTKPFKFAELRARIQSLLRRTLAASSRVLRAGQLELDCSRQEARFKGVVIGLTSKEFLLLEHLMQHKNLVQSRSRLFDCVWNKDLRDRMNHVDVCISKLRGKMECPTSEHPIETVRGGGFVIRSDIRGDR